MTPPVGSYDTGGVECWWWPPQDAFTPGCSLFSTPHPGVPPPPPLPLSASGSGSGSWRMGQIHLIVLPAVTFDPVESIESLPGGARGSEDDLTTSDVISSVLTCRASRLRHFRRLWTIIAELKENIMASVRNSRCEHELRRREKSEGVRRDGECIGGRGVEGEGEKFRTVEVDRPRGKGSVDRC